MGDHGYVWVSQEKILTPEDGATVNVVRDAWWVVNKDYDVLFYHGHRDAKGAPQMNRDKKIAQMVRHPDIIGVMQIPLAFYEVEML